MLLVYAAACALYGSAAPIRFSDTIAFETAANASPAHLDFYTGARPFATLFLYKAAANHATAIVAAQRVIAAVCWVLLAVAAQTLFRRHWIGLLAAALLLAFSLAWPVAGWNYVLLSESLCFSLAAAAAAALIAMFRRRALLPLAIIAVLVWGGTRDTAAYSITLLAVCFAVMAMRRRNRLFLAAAAVALFAVAISLNWTTERSGRWKTPLLNVILIRVLPHDPAYGEWIRDYGLPPSPRLRSLAGRYSWDRDPNGVEIRSLLLARATPGDGFNGFQNWFATRSLVSMRRYLVRHWRATAVSSLFAYAALTRSRAAWYLMKAPNPFAGRMFTSLFFPHSAMLVVALAAIIFCARTPLFISALLIVNSFVQVAIAFHGDVAELERHAFPGAVLLRMGLIIGICGALDALASARTSRNRDAIRLLIILEGGDAFPSGYIRALIYRDLFAQRGYDVTFRNRFSPRLLRFRERVGRWTGSRSGWTPRLIDVVLAVIAKIKEPWIAFESRNYDVVYTSKVLSYGLLRKIRTPIIYDFGDAVWLYPEVRHFDDILRLAAAVTTDNEFTASYARRFNEHCTVVPDVSQVEAFDAVRGTVSRNPDRVILGWIGSPGTMRNLEVFRPVLERLGRRFPNVELRLLGIGPGFRPFERIRCTAIPEYDREVMIAEVLRMDVGLFPLNEDEVSVVRGVNKAAIYMAGEAVVVASPVGESATFIEDGVTGVLATGDWEEKLARIIEDEPLRRTIAAAALAKVRRELPLERSFKLLDEVLRRAAKEPRDRAS